jgi:AraC-like DNA-binding protein
LKTKMRLELSHFRFCIAASQLRSILAQIGIRLAQGDMRGFGSKALTDPEDVFSNLLDVDVDLVLTSRVPFGAQVSWLAMRCLHLCVIEEDAPRLAFISLPPARLFISFSLTDDPAPVCNGIRLHRGDLVLHAPGDRFHHRTAGPVRWGLISIAPWDLACHGRTLLDRDFAPSAATLIRPSVRNSRNLLRLHAQACRLAATKPKLLMRSEVRRALEQDLIYALVMALATEELTACPKVWQRRSETMVRFEDALAMHDPARPLPTLCAGIGVPPRTLREYCAAYLGCSPLQYSRIRRLNLARSTLLRADPTVATVAQVARSHGFSELGRFAVAYRALFSEPPLATLLRSRSNSAEYA